MTTEQQEELLIGLRTEVLELKEILADNYYDKSQLSDIYVTDDNLSSKLKSYLTSTEINNKYKKITESDKRDEELEKLINTCALSSQLDDYVNVNDFKDYKSSISEEIKSLEESVTHNSDCIKSFYTKDEIDGMGFIKELPSIDYLASIEWVESKGYLTAHQSLDAYATINWVKTQLESKNMNLDAYAKISSIPKRTSDLVNDSGYLTEHQSLSGYAKTEDIDEIKADIYNIKSKFNNYTKNTGYITVKDVESYIGSLNLDGTYAKLSDIDDIVGNLNNYATLTDLSNVKSNYAKKSDIPDISLYYNADYIDETFETKDRVSSLLSEYALSKDVDKAIESIHDKFDNYLTLDYATTFKLYCANTYAKKSDIPDISLYYNADYINETFETKDGVSSLLSKYTLSDDFDKVIKSIQNKFNDYLTLDYDTNFKSYCNDTYATKSDIDECNINIRKVNEIVSNTQSSLTNYMKKSDVSAYYVTKSDFGKYTDSFVTKDDVSSTIYDKMSLYATVTELEKCKSTISTLSEFKSNTTTKLSKIENRIDDLVDNDYLKGKLNELKSSFISSDKLEAYITKTDASTLYDTKLNEYAKKVDIGKFITYSEAAKDYIKKNEIDSYIPNLSSYSTKSDLNEIKGNIEELTTDILNNTGNIEIINQKLSNYYTKTDVSTKISKIYSDLTTNLSNYAKKSDIPESVDLSPYAKTSYVDGIYGELVNYAKLTDIPDTANYVQSNEYNDTIAGLYKYIDGRTDYDSVLVDYVTESDLTKVTKSLVTKKEIDEKLSYYITASRLHDYVDSYISENIEQIVKNYINSQLNVYLTKREAEDTYLAIEDYKYLKSAAVIDDSFKYSYEDFYYSLYDKDGNPLDDVKLHNGFYIVEGTLYFVYNGEFIELEMIEYWKEEEK
jgi:hypothetical protein